MTIIRHQLQGDGFILPEWAINHLFIGTFNPETGLKVPYYYGRESNRTWELLSIIFKIEFLPNKETFFDLIREKRIACLDLIQYIEVPADKIGHVSGKGYKDTAIINTTVKRKYYVNQINRVIDRNPGIKVYSTWGKGPSLKEWKSMADKINAEVVSLASPSMAAKVPKGAVKFEYMLTDWRSKINIKY